MTSLLVSEEVRQHVDKYFAGSNGLTNYEPIAVGHCNNEEQHIYIVLAHQIRGGKWAVWTCWNEDTQCLNWGHYDLSEQEATLMFMRGSASRMPNEDRLSEIDTKAIDAMLEMDEEQALEILREDIELDENEQKYFEVDLEE